MATTVMTYEEKLAAKDAAAADALKQKAFDAQRQILYLSLLVQSGSTVTEMESPINGDTIFDGGSALYIPILENITSNPIRVQVLADLATGGAGIKISLKSEGGDSGLVDQLVLTANGKSESVNIIVLPKQKLWAKNFDAAFPLTNNDRIRIRVFDPQKLISYVNMYKGA